jgi:hypothetical protein
MLITSAIKAINAIIIPVTSAIVNVIGGSPTFPTLINQDIGGLLPLAI